MMDILMIISRNKTISKRQVIDTILFMMISSIHIIICDFYIAALIIMETLKGSIHFAYCP